MTDNTEENTQAVELKAGPTGMEGKDTVGARIIEMARQDGIPAVANSNITDYLCDSDKAQMQNEVEEAYGKVLEALGIDVENDHNTNGTAKRVAKMFMQEVFKGRYQEAPAVTSFPNARQVDDIYTLGPIAVRSACSHHMVPIVGECWIGVKPEDIVIGISKFHRMVDHIMRRPQIQEEAAMQIAEALQELTGTENIAVVVRATHMCMTWRGVEADLDSTMVSSVMHGTFRKNSATRAEFLNLIKGQNY